MDLKNLNFLIAGQLKTSRTEALEDYLCKRTNSLGVIGFMSPFASYDTSRCTFYERCQKVKEFGFPSYRVKKVRWWNQPLISFSFLLYIYSFFTSALRLRRKFDVFIGVATFSTFLGIILKAMGRVDKVVYYCLDYYPPVEKFNFNRFMNSIFKNLDKWIIKRADALWNISPRIKEARRLYAGVPVNLYPEVIVPLGYSDGISYNCSFEERERWTLGFVGTLSENQGLQMVIEAMPKLAGKFPEIKVRVLGHGPYTAQLKEMVKVKNLDKYFIFHGFVYNDKEVYEVLSKCMAGLATWTGGKNDNSLYADPGKPKLYALLGLPTIITTAPYVSKIISELKAGEVINYAVEDFILAVEKIIADKENFEAYKQGVDKFRPLCLAENIFNKAFEETVCCWRGKSNA